jgi:hypothetical protein
MKNIDVSGLLVILGMMLWSAVPLIIYHGLYHGWL